MSYILSPEEYKTLVKSLFESHRASEALSQKMEGLGFTSIEGDAEDVFNAAYYAIMRITPDYIADSDAFIADLSTMQDFEEFYDRYYTEREF